MGTDYYEYETDSDQGINNSKKRCTFCGILSLFCCFLCPDL